MNFSDALTSMKNRHVVARDGWNGKGQWIALINPSFGISVPEWGTMVQPLSPFIVIKTADGKAIPWVASQTDILADDWVIVS